MIEHSGSLRFLHPGFATEARDIWKVHERGAGQVTIGVSGPGQAQARGFCELIVRGPWLRGAPRRVPAHVPAAVGQTRPRARLPL